jgi:hypothetical protein
VTGRGHWGGWVADTGEPPSSQCAAQAGGVRAAAGRGLSSARACHCTQAHALAHPAAQGPPRRPHPRRPVRVPVRVCTHTRTVALTRGPPRHEAIDKTVARMDKTVAEHKKVRANFALRRARARAHFAHQRACGHSVLLGDGRGARQGPSRATLLRLARLALSPPLYCMTSTLCCRLHAFAMTMSCAEPKR